MKSVLIVIAPYYDNLAKLLLAGAQQALEDVGIASEVLEVPGAFEIPAAIACAAESDRYVGYVALGAVIRGQTSHYDYVCGESARGLQLLAVEQKLAIGYGILTCETMEQAILRADPKEGDKGGWAAKTCLRMIEIRNQFGVA